MPPAGEEDVEIRREVDLCPFTLNNFISRDTVTLIDEKLIDIFVSMNPCKFPTHEVEADIWSNIKFISVDLEKNHMHYPAAKQFLGKVLEF